MLYLLRILSDTLFQFYNIIMDRLINISQNRNMTTTTTTIVVSVNFPTTTDEVHYLFTENDTSS